VETAPARSVAAAPAAASPAQASAPAPVQENPARVATATASTVAPPATAPVVTTPDQVSKAGGITWAWPAQGTLASRYVSGDPTHQGIDIAGQLGDPVHAAAAGVVVYSGNGLIGYGELVIIKHNQTWLSAYGHNSQRLVQEGQHIRIGQVIADMGSSSAGSNALHFEIRKNGKPVDPLDYLPRR
jgi:lipoprotein NlpD